MAKYRVTLRHTTVDVVEASNPYQAAVIASGRHDQGTEVVQVAPAVGRTAETTVKAKVAKKATPARKRRRLSPEARAKLAQNLVKARAARAAKAKAAKKAAKKSPAKNAKRAATRR